LLLGVKSDGFRDFLIAPRLFSILALWIFGLELDIEGIFDSFLLMALYLSYAKSVTEIDANIESVN